MSLNLNNHESGFTVSYLDKSIGKLALSEVSYMPLNLIEEGIKEFINDPKDLDTILNCLKKSQETAFYSRLNVPPALRGQHIGSLLLKETLKFCEINNIFLFNTVNAYGDLTQEQLIDFYERNGMFKIHDSGVLIYSREFSINNNKRLKIK